MRREFLERLDKLEATAYETSKSFDQAMLTLSAGGGSSVTFLEKIAAEPVLWSIPFLVCAWAMFGYSIFAILYSFLCSIDQQAERGEQLVHLYYPGHEHHTSSSRRMKRRECLAKKYGDDPIGEAIESWVWRSVWAFLLGVLFLTLFSLINLVARGSTPMADNHVEKRPEGPEEKKGYRYPPIPPPRTPPPSPPPPPAPGPPKEAK